MLVTFGKSIHGIVLCSSHNLQCPLADPTSAKLSQLFFTGLTFVFHSRTLIIKFLVFLCVNAQTSVSTYASGALNCFLCFARCWLPVNSTSDLMCLQFPLCPAQILSAELFLFPSLQSRQGIHFLICNSAHTIKHPP